LATEASDSESAESLESAARELRDHRHVHWHRATFGSAAPRRIVSLVPSLSEALVVLGLGDRLVGVTEYCVHPARAFEGLPKVGGTKDADVAAIAALAPDLVIANQEENTARVVRALAKQEIDVWVTYPRSVAEGVTLLEDLARLGASDEAVSRCVTPVRAAFEAAETRRAQASGATESRSRPRVFCPIWRDPWMTIGRDTYIHDLLELCGADNAFAGPAPGAVGGAGAGRRYPMLSLDDLVAAAPEVILLPDEPYAFGATDLEALARLDMPAARSGRIHLIDGTLVSWYGPRIAEAIRVLAGFFANS
jgi:ABC-type Fe3+-hydroxamate transport system substrate-binding protein